MLFSKKPRTIKTLHFIICTFSNIFLYVYINPPIQKYIISQGLFPVNGLNILKKLIPLIFFE